MKIPRRPEQIVAEVLDLIKGLPFEHLTPIIAHIAQLVYEVRLANKNTNAGGVPKEVFEYLLGMGGVSVSVQVVHEVWNGSIFIGFALKKRDAAESGEAWAGQYHSPCTVLRMFDTPASALSRDIDPSLRSLGIVPPRGIDFLGVTLHDEPERRSACATIMHSVRVTREGMEKLSGTWQLFTSEQVWKGDRQIIDHNILLLQWVLNVNRACFADLRQK